MLTKTQMQQIQDLKLMGYTKTDIIRYYEARGEKPPSRPAISKYYDMHVVPDDPGEKLAKPKTFDAEPFRSTILRILETNSRKSFCMSWYVKNFLPYNVKNILPNKVKSA